MNRPHSKRRYNVEELVNAAYRQAALVTRNGRVASLVASRILEAWLAKSDRPDLIGLLATAS